MATQKAMPPLLAAIDQVTTDARVRLAMIFGAQMEGSFSGPWGTSPGGAEVGDQGHSYGPFQINLPYHPGVTPQKAVDPKFAAAYMAPSYASAVKKVPAGLWHSDPALAAEEAAAMAERPAQTYLASRGRAAVDNAYATAVKILNGDYAAGGSASSNSPQGATPPGTAPGAAPPGTATAQPAGLLGSILSGAVLNPFAHMFGADDFQDLMERLGLILVGSMLILIGFVLLVKDTGTAKAAEGAGILYATRGEASTRRGAVRHAARKAGQNRDTRSRPGRPDQ